MSSPRRLNPGQFIRETFALSLNAPSRSDAGVILGIDECVNGPDTIGALAVRLMESARVSQVMPLWYSSRPFADKQPEGKSQNVSALGGFDRASAASRQEAFRQFGLPELGRPTRGEVSWPDEGVVAMLVCGFLRADRLCLLTGNKANDRDGLRKILHDEVAPAIESVAPRRFGLTVLVQHSESTLNEYARAVEEWFTTQTVEPGFSWAAV